MSAGLPSWIGVCEGEAGGCCLLWFCVRFLSFCEKKAALLGGLRAVRPFLDVAASVGWLLARAGAPAFAICRASPRGGRSTRLASRSRLYSLVASFSKCNVIVRLQFDVRIIPNNVTSCESTRLRAATKTAWSAALGSTFCEWADAGYGCCFVIGHPCHFDWLRNFWCLWLTDAHVGHPCHFDWLRNSICSTRWIVQSETYVISTGSETNQPI